MTVETPGAVSLTSQWFIRPGCEAEVIEVVTQLAADVEAQQPDTLTYLVHTPWAGEGGLQSLPPSNPLFLLFFETYRDAEAFHQHVTGPLFTQFVQQYGNLFVPSSDGKPYTTVQFLSQQAGFVRG
jgi:quinol monooxygenase YgiN